MCLLSPDKEPIFVRAWETQSQFVDDIEQVVETSGLDLEVYLEKVASMPSQGVVSVFTFGENFGFIQGVLRSTYIPLTLVLPKEWQAPLRLKKAPTKTAHKNALKDAAIRVFPQTRWTLKTADAALIALYGYNRS